MRLKARIVPHGNREAFKDEVRKESASADLFKTELVTPIGVSMGFKFAVADIKGVYRQSVPIKREIYVSPSTRLRKERTEYWQLTKLTYGIKEAGRQWLKVCEEWMTRINLNNVKGAGKMFTETTKEGKLIILIAKTFEYFLITWITEAIDEFLNQLRKRFKVVHGQRGSSSKFNGCELNKNEDGYGLMYMEKYLERFTPVKLSSDMRRKDNEKATDEKTNSYRSMAGTLMHLGNGVLRQAEFLTSFMQKRLNELRVMHLNTANGMLKELMISARKITYQIPPPNHTSKIITFSDASHGSG